MYFAHLHEEHDRAEVSTHYLEYLFTKTSENVNHPRRIIGELQLISSAFINVKRGETKRLLNVAGYSLQERRHNLILRRGYA